MIQASFERRKKFDQIIRKVTPRFQWTLPLHSTGARGCGGLATDIDRAAGKVEDFSTNIRPSTPLEMPTCDMATVRDPDGNKLTIHRRKQSS